MKESDKKFIAPTSQLEKDIVAIWEKILDQHPIGVTDDFYGLGGHSLSGLRILAEIEMELGIQVPLAVFAQTRTIQKLVGYLGDQGLSTHLTALHPKGKEYPLFFVPPSARTAMIFEVLAKYLGEEQPFYGLEYSGMVGESEPHTRVELIAAQNVAELQKVQPEGPYFLGGMCFGGMVAYEMAQQLVAENQEVAFLGVLDSSFPPQQKISARIYLMIILSYINDKVFNGNLPLGPRGPRVRVRMAGSDDTLSKKILHVFSTHAYARMKYKSPPYPGKVTLFSTQRRNAPRIRAEWQKATTKELDIVTREVAKSPFIDEPHVQTLAQLLSEHLETASSNLGMSRN